MKLKTLAILTALSGLALTSTQAAVIFTIGSVGGVTGANNWPGGESPTAVNDNNGATKYLNQAKLNTGYIFTLTSGTAVVTGMNFTTANDAPDRDPASYAIYGSNTTTANTTAGTTYNVGTHFTQISSGLLTLPGGRTTAGGNVTFSNVTAYSTYLVVFPTVKNAGTAIAMQIGEAMLQTSGGNLGNAGITAGGVMIPEASSTALLAAGMLVLCGVRRRQRR